jgi:hypothetical protein
MSSTHDMMPHSSTFHLNDIDKRTELMKSFIFLNNSKADEDIDF